MTDSIEVNNTAAATGEDARPLKFSSREYTGRDRMLIAVALGIGILWDRMVFNLFDGSSDIFYSWLVMPSLFWICYLAVFYALFWKTARENKPAWLVSGLSVMLCAWGIIFDPYTNEEYASITYLVIPCVIMAFSVYTSGGFKLKQAGLLALEWLKGWFVKPFSALPIFFGSIYSFCGTGQKTTAKKILLAIGIILPVMLILLPLLSGADLVFGYYLGRILQGFDIGWFIFHAFVCFAAAALFYSFLWNLGKTKAQEPAKTLAISLDRLVCGIVLGAVLAVYLLFCAVQFVYLFAGAGLPDGLTYSEYAREGFWQLVVVSGINLLIFGVLLQCVQRSRAFDIMLAGLLGMTVLLLVSAIRRLGLYIDAYGLTWLRLLSAWFIAYLVAALALCGVRMVREKLPLIATCAIVLLAWYVLLGYANPGVLIEKYNLAFIIR